MSHQRDYEGKEYVRYIYDTNDVEIDEHYIDGDALQHERVDRSVHKGGGGCIKCGYTVFSVNGGKEYCALCNEFYDTYKYLRESTDVAQKRERQTRFVLKEIDRARRDGDFVKVKELEQVLIWTQMNEYKSTMTATEVQREEMLRQQKRAQDAYLAKKLNHMNSNRAQYYDIP